MSERQDEERVVNAGNVRVVRVGHGGNCSSVGSVIDTLFVSAAVGGAVLAAICAAMKSERVVVVGGGEGEREREGAGTGTGTGTGGGG